MRDMRIDRSFISFLMIVLMLPWGAYAGHAQSRLTPQNIYTIEQANTAPIRAAIQIQTPFKVSLKKKCRTATLPGSPCAPDRALLYATTTAFADPDPVVSISIENWHTSGQNTPPPRYPPRIF
jgi:hypothetical protein